MEQQRRSENAPPDPDMADAPESAGDIGDLAIVLDGGGARAAYQVGLLRGLARHHPNLRLRIITGVSAGAINAAFLAAQPGTLPAAVSDLGQIWTGMTVDQVFRVDRRSLLSNAWHWGLGLISGGRLIGPPLRGLVDTAPLGQTLAAPLRGRRFPASPQTWLRDASARSPSLPAAIQPGDR